MNFIIIGTRHSPVVSSNYKIQEEILQSLRILISRQQKQDMDLKRMNEWRSIAIAVDRILFWIFFAITTVSSIVFLLILPLTKRAEYVRNTWNISKTKTFIRTILIMLIIIADEVTQNIRVNNNYYSSLFVKKSLI